MDLRLLRLKNDYEELLDLETHSKYISLEYFGNPPERYIVTYTCTGLYRDDDTGEVRKCKFHQMEIVLGTRYPLDPPSFRWVTPVFHPNIYTENGLVCIGDIWSVSRELSAFVVDIGELVQFRRFNIYNPVNHEAAAWTRQNLHILPIGREMLLEPNQEDPEKAQVQVILGDFVGTMVQGNSDKVITYTRVEGPGTEEMKELSRILAQMIAVVSAGESISLDTRRDYEIESSNLSNELSKSQPNISRIREIIAFLGDVDGTLGLAARLAPYAALLTPLVQKIVGQFP